eukprot:13538176-Alexandrium_andersonii.AAC.1
MSYLPFGAQARGGSAVGSRSFRARACRRRRSVSVAGQVSGSLGRRARYVSCPFEAPHASQAAPSKWPASDSSHSRGSFRLKSIQHTHTHSGSTVQALP